MYSEIDFSNIFKILPTKNKDEIIDFIAEESMIAMLSMEDFFEKLNLPRDGTVSPLVLVLITYTNVCLYNNTDEKAIDFLLPLGRALYKEMANAARGQAGGREIEIPSFNKESAQRALNLFKKFQAMYQSIFQKFRRIDFKLLSEVIKISAAISILRGYDKVVCIFSI